MAEATFDRAAFARGLRTRVLGRTLAVAAATPSTNDWAWEAFSQGAPDGAAFVADAQTRGRGREGRRWESPPGQGLLMSLLLRLGCERNPLTLLPLLAGLAAHEALTVRGVRTALKWPNDLLLEGRKLAGVLCEARGGAGADRAAVLGLGLNVLQEAGDFPSGLRDAAVSLRGAGHALTREEVAAGFLNALEPLYTDYQEGEGAARLLDRYRSRVDFWGRAVTVRSAAGALRGVARDLSPEGGLVLRLEDGRETVAVAGDVECGEPEAR